MYLRLLYAGPSLYAGKTYAPPEVSISGGVGGVWAAARWNTMDEKGMLKDVQFLFSVASMRPSSMSPYTAFVALVVSIGAVCMISVVCYRVPPAALPLPPVDGTTGKRVVCSAVGYSTLRHATEWRAPQRPS